METPNPFDTPQDGVQVAGIGGNIVEAIAERMLRNRKPPTQAATLPEEPLGEAEPAPAPIPAATDEQALGVLTSPPNTGDKFAGNINLDRLDDPSELNYVVEETARQMPIQIDEARRGVQTEEATKQLAGEIGMTVDELLSRRTGEAWNAEQIMAARQILVASRDTIAAQAKQIQQGGGDSETLLGFRRALARHQAIQLQVSGLAAEAGRALQQFRIMAEAGDLRLHEVSTKLDAAGGEGVIVDMAKAISDIADKPGVTPAQINQSINNIAKATTGDMVMEYWINGLLSSPSTQLVNITSNLLVSFWTAGERALAGIHSGPIQSKEALASMYGMVEGWKDGLRMAGHVIKTGEPSDPTGKLEAKKYKAITAENVRALKGQRTTGLNGSVDMDGSVTRASRTLDMTINGLGHGVRLPGRFLMAADELFKAVGYRMELRAQAFRKGMSGPEADALTSDVMAYKAAISELQAKGEPFAEADVVAEMQRNGAMIGKTVEDLLMDGIPGIHMDANHTAHYNTFTKELGDAGKDFQGLIARNHGFKLIFPFVRTPINIMKFVGERTPISWAVKPIRDELAAGGARRQMALARMEMGSLTGAAMMTTVASNQDCETSDFCITGARPMDWKEAQTWDRLGIQDYSMKIGGSWHAYNRLDPLGWMLGAMTDGAKIIELQGGDSVEAQEVAAAIVLGISNNVVNKTYLRGISDIMEIFTTNDKEAAERYLKNFAGSFLVPMSSLNRFASGSEDPYLRDASTFMEEIKLRVYGTDKTKIPVKRDFWGEKRKRSSGMVLRSKGQQKDSPVDIEFLRLGWHPSMPDKEVFGVELNEKEYSEYMRMFGEKVQGKTLKGLLKNEISKDAYKKKSHDDDQLPGSRQDILNNVIKVWKKATDARFMKENPEFLEKVLQHKQSIKEGLQ